MKSFTAHVDENGKLALDNLPSFPPGVNLAVLVMSGADIDTLEGIIDLVSRVGQLNPALLERLETLDEALWDMQFASSQEVLTELAEQAHSEHEQGKTEELNLDE